MTATATPEHSTMERLLSTAEATEVLGFAPGTLAKMRLVGSGPNFVKLGRRTLYRPSDLKTWVNARVVRSTAEAEQRQLNRCLTATP